MKNGTASTAVRLVRALRPRLPAGRHLARRERRLFRERRQLGHAGARRLGGGGAGTPGRAGGEAERAAAARRPSRLRQAPKGPLLVEHANLFDAESGAMKPGSSVLVDGDTIRAVGADGSFQVPPGTQRIDAAGRALVPGLWDMHSHPEPADGLLLLAAGVTGVRDMAAEPAKRERMKGWDTGETLGPRIAYAGIVDGPGPFQGPTQVLVDTEAEARAAVDAMADAGFILVKVYSSVKPELVPVDRRRGRQARPARRRAHPGRHDRGTGGARRVRRNPAHEHAVPQLHVRSRAGHAHAGAPHGGRGRGRRSRFRRYENEGLHCAARVAAHHRRSDAAAVREPDRRSGRRDGDRVCADRGPAAADRAPRPARRRAAGDSEPKEQARSEDSFAAMLEHADGAARRGRADRRRARIRSVDSR